MKPILFALALTGLMVLAQSATQISLRKALEFEKVLISLELLNTKPLGSYQKTRAYSIRIRNPRGVPVPLLLWLAPANGKPYVAYASVGYVGPSERDGAMAFGYLSAFLAANCMGLDAAQREQFKKLGEGFFPKLSQEWKSESLRFGETTATIAGQLTSNGVSLNTSFENRSTPGRGGWRYTCGLE
jgi:hypothetical protein